MKILSIVVTYNGKKWIDKCLRSQISSTLPMHILIVDNGSTDDTPGIIRKNYPQVEVIEIGENLGFGKANNIGLKKALAENFDYVFLLNQDAWVEYNTVENMVSIHLENRKFGILCPIQLNGDGSSIDLMFHQYTLAVTRGLIKDALFNEDVKDIYPVSFANAACWLIPKNTLTCVGGFDPIFNHYGEDDDYVNRMVSKGYLVGICPSEKVYHDREYRVSSSSQEKIINELFIKYLIIIKTPETATPKRSHYYKKMLFKGLLYFCAPNSNFYKCEFLALKKIIKVYNAAVNHKSSEKTPYSHYLNA